MTREEAIAVLRREIEPSVYEDEKSIAEAIDLAISALQAEQNYVHIETYRDLYEKYIELKHKSAEPIKAITDDTIEVRYTDFENIKRIILTNGDIFCKMFYEDARQNDDSDYDSLVPDEYKTEPSDLISRADAIDAVMKHKMPFSIQQEVAREIDALPSADRPIGEWKQGYRKTANGVDFCVIACSECDYYDAQMNYYNYCPSCGARMGVEE